MSSIGDRMLALLEGLHADDLDLPEDVIALDPMHGANAREVRRIVRTFHDRFYADNAPRHLLLGINPGRLGAGTTGLAFTDTKRCESDLGIPVKGVRTHEPSSDMFYRFIRDAGGPERVYGRIYVSSLLPLGLARKGDNGTLLNLNYYDRKDVQEKVSPFITGWLHRLVEQGALTDKVFCLGKGKNAAFLQQWNREHHLFGRVVPLEHPRYIMQYKARELDSYVLKYREALDPR